jgi:hypothetical protein
VPGWFRSPETSLTSERASSPRAATSSTIGIRSSRPSSARFSRALA